MKAGYQFDHQERKRPAWLVTFADLVALLITFFVMLFATQKVDIGKWESLVNTLSMRLNPHQTILIARPSADKNVERLSRDRAINLDYLEKVIRSKTLGQPELAGLELARHEDRLVVTLPAPLLFRSGKADPIESARPILFVLAGVLGTIGNRVDVVGHADPRPIAVANELRRAGYHREMSPSGFGASAFRELSSSLPVGRRNDLSRRVDIVIWPTRGIQ